MNPERRWDTWAEEICFEQKIHFFPTYRLLFPAVLRRKHLEQWCIPVVPAWSVQFCLCGVAHMHSVTDGGFVSHRWAPVFHSSCAPGHTQKTAFPFISGITFLVMARGMIQCCSGSDMPQCSAPAVEEENGVSSTSCQLRVIVGPHAAIQNAELNQVSPLGLQKCGFCNGPMLCSVSGELSAGAFLLSMQVFCWDQLFRALKSLSTLPYFH